MIQSPKLSFSTRVTGVSKTVMLTSTDARTVSDTA